MVRQLYLKEITLEAFLVAYDDFYDQYALDGHEADETGKAILQRFERQICLHLRIRDEILYRLTSSDFASNPEYAALGFIGPSEAETLIRQVFADWSSTTG